jgi:tetratricopeptide (TPR) repeat protein
MFKKPLLAAVIVLAVSVAAWPQVQGKLMGVVKDGQGNPVEKASVHIVSTKTTSVNYELTTNKEGRFLQVGIQPGYFQVTVKKDGYMPKTTEARVSLAGETNLEFKLDTADEVALRSISAADKVFLKGNKLYGEQKYAEAAAAYEEAVGMSQTNWGYYLNLGLAYKKLDKKAESLAAFRKAVEISPESYSANKELGEALAKDSAFDEARKYYQKAVDLSPDDPDAHFNLGACLTNTGENDAALGHFRRATELRADFADAYYQMGTIYIGLNKVPEAVQSLEKFLELAPAHEKAPLAKQLLQYLKK